MKKVDIKLLILAISVLLNGCASLGKGITEAILEKQEEEDTRICEIKGEKFEGIKPQLEVHDRKMKLLMVHGVGNHLPGYSTQFMEKLAKELDLTVTSRNVKNIRLSDAKGIERPLGNLRIHRYLDASKSQEMLFYELTWSEISAKEKEVLSYDNSGEQSFRRAEVNDLLKKFSNDTGPDPIIYLGEKREDILSAFAQSFCWMIQGDWNSLPDDVKQTCSTKNVTPFYNDSYAFVSHSLGSRITIDGLQQIASKLSNGETANYYTALTNVLKNKEIPIYMMSNQLPMLQLGRALPEVANQADSYCRSEGAKYNDRIMAKTSVIAFSDPNDLLSYAIPHDFVNKYLDSRLCINVTNININVARVYDAFGLGKLANPMDAHIGYDTDDRVIALIAKGIANEHTAPIVKERCHWVETID
ncbi:MULTISPECIES: hypothetical protein [Methylomonas]|uniref:Alpha/beta hydrolase n=2 Tax=Methylomonas TaxID=416 RepID=A0A140E705_9GAMM|nr:MULTISPECIES: hypothetical protein [Methylomonas]AMK79179.1 hypothetical protein JT25_022295 [Methylomonas denitrificans]OAH98187.1 hypothetical protein A1342_00525 [Methylomonas methanica]TCV86303.1 hypothetical protein EDE11_104247 [Methylomonas methanica]